MAPEDTATPMVGINCYASVKKKCEWKFVTGDLWVVAFERQIRYMFNERWLWRIFMQNNPLYTCGVGTIERVFVMWLWET